MMTCLELQRGQVNYKNNKNKKRRKQEILYASENHAKQYWMK